MTDITTAMRRALVTEAQLADLQQLREAALVRDDMRAYYAMDLAIAAMIGATDNHYSDCLRRAEKFQYN